MKINAIVGPDSNRLFSMDGVRLNQNEIIVNNKRGVQCTMGLNSTEKWQLGSFIMNQIKMDDVCRYFLFFYCPIIQLSIRLFL